ncbi:VCBS repeat-containing protein, partial [bacterium]|nr:VCBS repeat-containing protein [bacterium]
MRNVMIVVIIFFSSVFAYDFVVEQTDWMGGSGISEPVLNWGTQYAERESVTTATPNSVSLVASEVDYLNWIKHIIDFGTGSSHHRPGFQPVNIDNDGDIDLIGYTDHLKWYECIGHFSYTSHDIETGSYDDTVVYICPADFDCDGDIDIVRSRYHSIDWFEQDGAIWHQHYLDTPTGGNKYRYLTTGDVDNDGDIDIVGNNGGSIVLYRNNGSGLFSIENIAFSVSWWRIYLADMDNDGDLDICNAIQNLEIYINDGDGNFSLGFSGFDDVSLDGIYPEDIDMDGDLDVVVGVPHLGTFFPNSGFAAFINDGTGINFTPRMLWTDMTGMYEDGAMAADIDLDGFPDIAGTYGEVGWLRQNPTSPLNFTLYTIDYTPAGSHWSHWLYIANADNENCAPTMDLFTTFGDEYIIYENNMILAYASIGTLASSILDGIETVAWHRIGWDACIPYDNSIAFYWRAGNDISTFSSIPWNGPIPGIVLDTPDSTDIDGLGRYFQYKVEFCGGDDIAVLHKFWVEYDTFALVPPTAASIEYNEETDCDGINTVEICYTIDSPDSIPADVSIEFSDDGGVSWTVSPSTVTDAEGDLGINIVPGDHCFNWILSTDVPGIEGRDWSARIIVSALDSSDTAYYFAPLDSRPPDVNIFDYPVQIQFPDSVILNWSVSDMFWSHQPGTLSIICGSDTIDTVLSDTFFVWHPNWDSLNCNSVIFRVVMRDSFCNWGEDTCVTGLCPDIVPPEIIPIDTLSKCFDF